VCEGGAWLARLRNRGERAAGVGARRGLCEGMRVRGGGAGTDGGLRVLGRGSFGVLCCGVGAGTKGTSATARGLDEASRPGPTGITMKETTSTTTCTDEASAPRRTKTGECGVGVVAGAAQEQATQAAAEREAAWELCGCDREEGWRTREHGLT
jgi:hypothetical protein